MMNQGKDNREVVSPRILILGGAGMLGHKLFQKLRAEYPGTICTIHGRASDAPFSRIPLFQSGEVIEGLDANNFEELSRLLLDLRPDFLINCIGVIKQRDIATAYIPTITLNALLPHRLAELAAKWKGRIIHFSTDCVFSGIRGMYTEQDQSDAVDLYGRTKYLGETTEPNALTLRTSIIGRELVNHRSLLDWFLSKRGGKVDGYRKSIYSGVTTNHLADVIKQIIAHHPQLSGLYQVTSTPISKYDLLCLVKEAYDLNITINPVDGERVDRSMDGSKFANATAYKCPSWKSLVQQLAEDPTPYGKWL
jgi:dTDP-4-dehydrorhamnose reductase